MAYYYVKSGGTATADAGRATSQRTGTFAAMGASAYYDHIGDALAASTAPTSGDFICCASDHAKAHTSAETIQIPVGVTIISVDVSNAENQLDGAEEQTSSGSFTLQTSGTGPVNFDGVTLSPEDDILYATSGSNYIFRRCTLEPGGQGSASSLDNFQPTSDGIRTEIHDSDIKLPDHASAYMCELKFGNDFVIHGSTIVSNTTPAGGLCKSGSSGGGIFQAVDTDFSNMASGFNLLTTAVAANDDIVKISFYNCIMPSTWTFGVAPANTLTEFTIHNCTDGNNRSISGYRNLYGYHLTDNTVYDDGADTVAGQTLSQEIVTSSSASYQTPFRFLLGSVYSDFSTSKDVVVQLVHDAQGSGTGSRFENDEAWIEVHRPNSADPGALIESTSMVDAFDTAVGTYNTASTNTWTGTSMTSETTEEITLSTTASGGTGWAQVYLCIGVASIAAGDLFASPDISVT